MMPRSLYGRIALVFAAIVLSLGVALSWFGYRAAKLHQHEILQGVNLALAQHIAGQLLPGDVYAGTSARREALFSHLAAANPNIETYLLDRNGWVMRAFPDGSASTFARVDLRDVQALAAGKLTPVQGVNPRHPGTRVIFSAAPIKAGGNVEGYVYIVLLNDMYAQMVDSSLQDYVLRSTGLVAGIALLAALFIGLLAFAAVTRRLRQLTREAEAFAAIDPDNIVAIDTGDEIDGLALAFHSMRGRMQQQMTELGRQDALRRELVANVSHDLRTPLASMQGYLETLARMGDSLDREEQKRYLAVAVRQSLKVSRLATQLFELARLEYEEVQPQRELFSIAELVQDIAQKYELTADEQALRLSTHVEADAGFVLGDIGMIERVISNLLDNAIRHTPERGEVRLKASTTPSGIEICVSDTGEGIAAEDLSGLFERGSPLRQMAIQRGGGLGLLIAKRILALHGCSISAASRIGQGTQISFKLPAADVA